VRFWGLASREPDEAIDLYTTRAEAEQAPSEILKPFAGLVELVLE
jgi:hypothetical protein